MGSMNRVFLMGNVTRDLEMRHTATGTSVLDLGLAINEDYRDKAGELVKSTCFVDVVVWGRQAEACSQYLSKGSPALIEGRLQHDQWETPQGEKRSRLRVRASRVQFLGRPPAETSKGQGKGTPGPQEAEQEHEQDPELVGEDAVL